MDQLGSSAMAARGSAQQAALRATLGKYKRGERVRRQGHRGNA